MIGWLTRQRKMVGGLYFGAPAWLPERIEGEEEMGGEKGVWPERREEMLAMLERIGMGGGGRTSGVTPGVAEQFRELGDRKMRALVLNLIPTQPEFALGAGMTRMEEPMGLMVEGLLALQQVVQAKRVIVVMDRHDWKGKRLWRRAVKGKGVEVKGLLNRYPQGDPTVLIRSLFGKRVSVGTCPVWANRMVVDPVACWGIGRWLRWGLSFKERPVQLFATGEEPRLVMGEIGETLENFLERQRVKTSGMEFIVNGVMSGERVELAGTKIETWTESVAVREQAVTEAPSPCFGCGWCLDVCPTELNPIGLLDLSEQGEEAANLWEAREAAHCVGCGLCSYVCPTRLPLMKGALQMREWVVGHEPDGGGGG